jgi:hypothetical protein
VLPLYFLRMSRWWAGVPGVTGQAGLVRWFAGIVSDGLSASRRLQ